MEFHILNFLGSFYEVSALQIAIDFEDDIKQF